MTTLNVRLSHEDAKRAEALRERGVVVSDVVRRAIRSEYEHGLGAAKKAKRPSDILDEILAEFPDRPNESAITIDRTDRRAVAAFIRQRLKKGRA